MSTNETPTKLTRKDFTSDQEVRWCPGCGDYAILAAMQRALPTMGVTRENTVFVSGIGCSSRFPYYMDTYGFHTIHGRAPAVATGLKLANPELDVWIITGDGDGLSIGGNHLMHVLRRNVNVQIMLFNNRIYGLTKGQYSPTSVVGIRTPSTPMGSIDEPLVPAQFALGAGARFVARGIDTSSKTLTTLLTEAREHQGAAFIEILQNCPVFNDGAFGAITDRAGASTNQLWLEHGQPMRFGPNNEFGLRLNAKKVALEVVEPGKNGVTDDDILVHDRSNRILARLLVELTVPDFPMVFGVIYQSAEEPYDVAVHKQNRAAEGTRGIGDLAALLRSGHTWTVDA